jgi:uncharacterized delta-60 repeat protein
MDFLQPLRIVIMSFRSFLRCFVGLSTSRFARQQRAVSRKALRLETLEGRLTPSSTGFLDPLFGSSGTSLVTYGLGSTQTTDIANNLLVQPDGKTVVVGSTEPGAFFGGGNEDLAITRLNPDGSLDSSFGLDGKVIVPVDLNGPTNEGGSAVGLQTDGKIVVAGSIRITSTDQRFIAYRLNPDGSVDGSFGTGGKVVFSFDSAVAQTDGVHDLAIQSDGKILLIGGVGSAANGLEFGVARLNSDGSLDTSFDGDGLATVPFTSGDDQPTGVAVRADGKIMVSGYISSGTSNDFLVCRLNSDGSLDTTFDSDGTFSFSFGSGASCARMAVQSDNKVVLVGTTSD